MATEFTWNGPAVQKKIEAELKKRLAASAVVVVNHCRVLLSVDGTGVRSAPATVGGKRKKKGSLIYGANPSKSGEPPHLQTGRLRASMAWELTGLVARVGTSIPYGLILEKFRDRVFLRRALDEKAAEVNAILSRPMDF